MSNVVPSNSPIPGFRVDDPSCVAHDSRLYAGKHNCSLCHVWTMVRNQVPSIECTVEPCLINDNIDERTC
jgi:hypothetical protein